MDHLIDRAAEFQRHGRVAQKRGMYALAFGWYTRALAVLDTIEFLQAQNLAQITEAEHIRIAALFESLAQGLERIVAMESNGHAKLGTAEQKDSLAAAARVMLDELYALWG